jgi:hypothetical protein
MKMVFSASKLDLKLKTVPTHMMRLLRLKAKLDIIQQAAHIGCKAQSTLLGHVPKLSKPDSCPSLSGFESKGFSISDLRWSHVGKCAAGPVCSQRVLDLLVGFSLALVPYP